MTKGNKYAGIREKARVHPRLKHQVQTGPNPSDIHEAVGTGELIKIAGCDPGKQRDSFALVSVVVNPAENELFVEFAKRWLRKEYLHVEAEINKFNKKAQWQNLFVEQNNTGEHVIEVLKKKYNLPVKPITTFGKMSNPDDHHKVKTMSKPEMVMWYLKAKQQHLVKFPLLAYQSTDMKELERQVAIFAEHKTEAGNVAYYAPGEEHDDLVMALLIACFAARKWIRLDDGEGMGVIGGTISQDTSNGNAFSNFNDWYPNHLMGV